VVEKRLWDRTVKLPTVNSETSPYEAPFAGIPNKQLSAAL
jgi:hypothetical protein